MVKEGGASGGEAETHGQLDRADWVDEAPYRVINRTPEDVAASRMAGYVLYLQTGGQPFEPLETERQEAVERGDLEELDKAA